MKHTTPISKGCEVRNMEVSGESALDVLSRAASLVTNEVKPAGGRWLDQLEEMHSKTKCVEAKGTSLKDLRLRALKRRKKLKSNDYFTAKLKARRTTTTTTTSTQTSMTMMESSHDDERASTTCSSRASNYDDDDEDFTSDKEDIDMPLDMTTTKRSISTCKENCSPDSTMLRKCLLTANPSPLLRPTLDSQERPSVITRSTVAPNKDVKKKKTSSKDFAGHRCGHRREILSGMCDPVIDEHFRRSLGKDYSEVFSSSPVSSSSNNSSSTSTVSVCGLSVDDHFAKALGDIWLQLQKKTHTSSSSSSPSPSLSPELAPPVSPLIQQC